MWTGNCAWAKYCFSILRLDWHLNWYGHTCLDAKTQHENKWNSFNSECKLLDKEIDNVAQEKAQKFLDEQYLPLLLKHNKQQRICKQNFTKTSHHCSF